MDKLNGILAIVAFIKRTIVLTDEEAKFFAENFKLAHIRKGQFIIQPGFNAQYRTYVLQGAFRSYVIDDKGNDHTISFAIEDWWISDVNSYIYQKPATMHVVALENSVVLQLDHEAETMLKAKNWKYETFFRIMAERGFAFLQRTIISNLMNTAEQRYENFLSNYPQVVNRLPQYALASYLGMTTQYLSKIRKRRIASNSNGQS